MIKNKEEPLKEKIDSYAKKIEYYLSSLGAKIEIVMYDEPIDIHSSINGVPMDSERYWFEGFLVNTPEVKDLKVRMFDPGFQNFEEGKELEGIAWNEACSIQNYIYRYLDKNEGNPKDGDKYWDLWDKIKHL